jgi:hypothetical protein
VDGEVCKIPVFALDVFESCLIFDCFDIQICCGLDECLFLRLSPCLQIVFIEFLESL